MEAQDASGSPLRLGSRSRWAVWSEGWPRYCMDASMSREAFMKNSNKKRGGLFFFSFAWSWLVVCGDAAAAVVVVARRRIQMSQMARILTIQVEPTGWFDRDGDVAVDVRRGQMGLEDFEIEGQVRGF